MNSNSRGDGLEVLLRALKLPAFVAYHEEVAEQAEKQGWSFNPGRKWPKRPSPPDRTARTDQVSRSSISN